MKFHILKLMTHRGNLNLPEDPVFSTGVGPFSNANIFVLDQHIAEFKTDLKFSTSPLLSPILH
jgi:hypothetical protein